MPHGRLETDPITGKVVGSGAGADEKSDVLILMHGQGEICQLYLPSKIKNICGPDAQFYCFLLCLLIGMIL